MHIPFFLAILVNFELLEKAVGCNRSYRMQSSYPHGDPSYVGAALVEVRHAGAVQELAQGRIQRSRPVAVDAQASYIMLRYSSTNTSTSCTLSHITFSLAISWAVVTFTESTGRVLK